MHQHIAPAICSVPNLETLDALRPLDNISHFRVCRFSVCLKLINLSTSVSVCRQRDHQTKHLPCVPLPRRAATTILRSDAPGFPRRSTPTHNTTRARSRVQATACAVSVVPLDRAARVYRSGYAFHSSSTEASYVHTKRPGSTGEEIKVRLLNLGTVYVYVRLPFPRSLRGGNLNLFSFSLFRLIRFHAAFLSGRAADPSGRCLRVSRHPNASLTGRTSRLGILGSWRRCLVGNFYFRTSSKRPDYLMRSHLRLHRIPYMTEDADDCSSNSSFISSSSFLFRRS